jgi:hypothetical protein
MALIMYHTGEKKGKESLLFTKQDAGLTIDITHSLLSAVSPVLASALVKGRQGYARSSAVT